jgi:predicted DNA-binding transcriptional regulator YafY
MRRADRLFQIVQLIRGRRLTTAQWLAQRLEVSERTVWPLNSFFWGAVWTLVAWCEKRQAFRSFRLDRIQSMTVLTETFKLSDGQRLMDYLRQQGVDPQALAEGR